MTPPSFDAATTWLRTPDGRWRGEVHPSWLQGRGAFGGVVVGAALHAMEEITPLPVLGLGSDLIGPLEPGGAELSVRVLREGRTLTRLQAELTQGGTVRAVVMGQFGGPRDSAAAVEPKARPRRRPPEALPGMPRAEGIPAFTQHFDYRWTDGSPPYSGSANRLLGGWLRHRTQATGAAALLGLLDAYPAPVVAMLPGPAPVSTVCWSARFVRVPERLDGWWWLLGGVTEARDGVASTRAALHAPDGSLAAHMTQLVAVYG